MYFHSFIKKREATVLFLSLLTSLFSYSQSNYKQTIKGYIIDAESKKTLVGITVQVTPGNASTISDSSGFYLLKDIPVGRYAIQYTSVGYETKTPLKLNEPPRCEKAADENIKAAKPHP